MVGCLFEGITNHNGNGGAIYAYRSNLNIIGTTFASCRTDRLGGAIGIDRDQHTVTLQDLTFRDNSGNCDGTEYYRPHCGDAIWWEGAPTTGPTAALQVVINGEGHGSYTNELANAAFGGAGASGR